MNNVWKSSNQKHNFGFDLNIWEQRDFGISPKLNYHLSIKKNFGFYTSFGYKSYGYLNGYGLKESLLLDFGLYFSVLKK